MGDISIKGHSPILRQGFAAGGIARGARKAADTLAAGTLIERVGGSEKGKPHSTRAGRISAGVRKIKRGAKKAAEPFVKESIWLDKLRKNKAEGGRMGFKKGGSDKNWIQKATASIKRRKTKGKCTPITKPGCTGRAKALAKTFKKMAKKRKAA